MNSRCADCNYEDCRCDRPPMPAANPWRYDAENAPKDGSIIMADFGCHGEPLNIHIIHWDGDWWSNKHREFEYSLLRAFATINPPEIEG